jgi:DNA mismatch repair protein MutS
VLDERLGEQFVPNDTFLGKLVAGGADGDGTAEGETNCSGTLALITGPNMAGKSTYIRQTALIVLLAHTGSFVPADRATIGVCDRIFTRIGASDELHTGQSTFMVEMTEAANICHHASEKSLVILDEIGRGTSTLDGLSLAWAIAEHLARRGPRTLFATHYHELTSLAERDERIVNLNVTVREWQDQIVFLHRIVPGATDRSYGIHVAKIAGMPVAVVQRASALLGELAVNHNGGAASAVPARPTQSSATQPQLPLFTEYVPHPVVTELCATDLNSLSPLAAFDLLRELQKQLMQDRG